MISPELKDEIQKRLNEHFSITKEIDDGLCLTPSDGRNWDRHVKVRIGDQWYGFKAYPEANRKNEDPNLYAEQDELISRLALLVRAPNACRIEQVQNIATEPFNGWTVNIVEWLPNSVTLNSLPSSAIDELRDSGEDFFYQFGQWLAFGLAFGIQDRRIDQFVFSIQSRKLAMIDMDYCFVEADLEPYSTIISVFRPEKKAKLSLCHQSLLKGVAEMKERISANCVDVFDALKNSSSPTAQVWNIVSIEKYQDAINGLLN
ncbi:MAG: hypothetical protein SFY67_12000 [Candidatus Melainabacteria bacterium]|nr:hypothetical protein [Candidatus Melainabacteria bacterium]